MSTLVKNPIVENGIIDQPKRLKKNVKIGAKIKLNVLAFVGITDSFNNSLSPSARGCSSPKNPTTLGPIRCCIPPIIFRSANVRYATLINTGRTIAKKETSISKINIKKNYTGSGI
jgi:hypothetical protein